MKQEIRIDVFDGEQYDGDWPPEDWPGFLAWFATKLDSVPVEHRSKAKVEINSGPLYDGDYASIYIHYARTETDEEEADREARCRELQEQQRRNELAALAILKARYEPTVAMPGSPQPPDAATGSGSGRTGLPQP